MQLRQTGEAPTAIATASAAFMWLLFLGFSGMLLWAALGAVEFAFGVALVAPLQNPDFPPGTQFLHWVLAAATGATFVFGYLFRWRPTGYVMVTLFAMLATLCFIETVEFMTNEGRYAAYVSECISYLVVGTYLLRSRRSAAHFGGRATEPAADSVREGAATT